MAKITGKVLRPFTSHGKDYKKGDEINLHPLTAATFEKAGRISLTKTDIKTAEAEGEKLAEKVEKQRLANLPATNVTTSKTPVKAAKKK